MQPHAGQRVMHAGAPLDTARAVMIMVHGRNAAPENILELSDVLDRTEFAYVGPAAAGGTWYPYSFMAPREQNEPGISSGLAVIESLVTTLLARGFPAERIMLLGFSQGACLTSEFSIRHPRRYGGVMALSGGLIGPPRPGTMSRRRSTARRCSSAAATWTHTFRPSGCARARRCFVVSAPRSRGSSTRAWATLLMATRSRTCSA
jgi:predicted esterase